MYIRISLSQEDLKKLLVQSLKDKGMLPSTADTVSVMFEHSDTDGQRTSALVTFDPDS